MDRTIYFNVTFACNSRCIFCAADFYGNSCNNIPDLGETDFRRILTKLSAQPGDSVIINGGEPTIHKDFFGLLTVLRDFGALPIVFTNGLNLSDIKLARRIAEFAPIDICIPFFGATAERHDFLTGRPGNFLRTWEGFTNVVKFIEEGCDIRLEAKLLLSKATSSENIEIAHSLMSNFDTCFHFSLNPLIISRKVIENSDLLIESFSGMKEETEMTIDYIVASGFDIEMQLLPFCTLDSKYTELLPSAGRTLPDYYYFDPKYLDEDLEHAVPRQFCSEECRPCVYNGICQGFYPEYLEIFGAGEIRPYEA
jgi:pyruvate-formate lyase-activating enzyme